MMGLGGVGLMGVVPGGRPGGINPAWRSGVPGLGQRMPFQFVAGRGGPIGAAGLVGGPQPGGGLLGGLPGGGGVGIGGLPPNLRPQLNPRFPGYRF